MSTTLIVNKDYSYSQYRNQKSYLKNDLSKSYNNLNTSINNITVEKTTEVQSLQQQLHNLIRNRSFSGRIQGKKSPDIKTFYKSAKNIKIEMIKKELKGKQNILQQKNELSSRNMKPKKSLLLNQTFEPIQENCIQNQQDDIYEKNHKNDGKQKNLITKNKKVQIKKKINNNKILSSQVNVKKNVKATIDELDQMQKNLASVKNIKKNQLKIKETTNRQPFANKLNHVASQNKIVPLKQKPTKPKAPQPALSSHSLNIDSIQTQRVNQKPLSQKSSSTTSIKPTKMINSIQKQKLLKQLEEIKQAIKGSQISHENADDIRVAMQGVMGMLLGD